MTEVTVIPLKHSILISFPEQSDYENNKTRIKRIIKTKHKLNKFIFTTGEWFNENDIEKSIVVKRFTNEKGYTNALLFKGSQIFTSLKRFKLLSMKAFAMMRNLREKKTLKE